MRVRGGLQRSIRRYRRSLTRRRRACRRCRGRSPPAASSSEQGRTSCAACRPDTCRGGQGVARWRCAEPGFRTRGTSRACRWSEPIICQAREESRPREFKIRPRDVSENAALLSSSRRLFPKIPPDAQCRRLREGLAGLGGRMGRVAARCLTSLAVTSSIRLCACPLRRPSFSARAYRRFNRASESGTEPIIGTFAEYRQRRFTASCHTHVSEA